MIGFKNQEEYVQHIVADLLNDEYPWCWNLTVPPGFGEDSFIEAVYHNLCAHKSKPAVAKITVDSVPDVSAYIRELHRQWGQRLDLPPLDLKVSEDLRLKKLITSLPREFRTVQIIQRFHKLLSCMKEWVLGALRDAEQSSDLQTLTVTPVSIDELKRRWERNHILTVSNYGEKHKKEMVDVLDVDEVIKLASGQGISPSIAKYIFALTGGYPEPFTAVARLWLSQGKPPLRPSIRKELRETAVNQLIRFVKWLDSTGNTVYRDAVIHNHQNFEPERAYDKLTSHPWKKVLFAEGHTLRAECLGEAAIEMSILEAATGSPSNNALVESLERAASLYDMGRYAAADRILGELKFALPRLGRDLLHAHARVMSALYGGNYPGEDTDWKALLRGVQAARELIQQHADQIHDEPLLASRYDDLEQIAKSILEVVSTRCKDGDSRVVDALAGLSGQEASSPATAALLLVLKFAACSKIPGSASACQAVLSLPEQSFRVWAFWRLNVNYYSCPDGCESVWDEAERHWPSEVRGPLQQVSPGEKFHSLIGFAFFCFAKLTLESPEHLESTPMQSFKEVISQMSMYEDYRNSRAHAWCLTNERDRGKFFGLCDRWLKCMLAACPVSASHDELLSLIEPLPRIDESGVLEWAN